MKKWLKVALIIVAALLVLVVAIGFLAGDFLYNFALNPNYDRTQLFQADHNQIEMDEVEYDLGMSEEELAVSNEEWLGGVELSSISMTSHDGLLLKAQLIPADAPSERWAVLCHGYMSKGMDMVFLAR